MPFKLAALQAIDLTDDKRYQRYLNYLKDRVRCRTTDELLLVRRFFAEWFPAHPDFQSQFPDRAATVDALVTAGKWQAISGLKLDEIVDLFRNHLAALFTVAKVTDDEDDQQQTVQEILERSLRTAIDGLANAVERDKFKQQIIQALEQNQEQITTAPFFLAVKASAPTTANWLAQYQDYAGPKHNKFSITRFIKQHPNAVSLQEIERRGIQLLLECYERLRTTSSSVTGFEQQICTPWGTIDYGEEHRYTKEQIERFRQGMKNYATILEESHKTLPDSVHDVVYGPRPRPPVERITIKGAKTAVIVGPDINATKGPDHFTASDEADIQRHEEEVAALAKPTKSEADYLQVASDIKQSVALSFATPEQDKRFTDLIVSVLRGLRDTMELKTYLLDLSFPTAEADAVVEAVNAQIATTPNAASSSRRAGKVPAPKLAGKPTLAQITKTTTDLSPAFSHPSLAREGTGERSTFLPKLRRSRTQKRQIIDDVRLQPSMVMSPIDELRAMDTLEFRRLSPDPNQAAARLRDKVELLSEESIVKQAQGVEAFKQSPLNMLYLALGNESIASGKEVTAIIAEHDATGTPSLSVDEFNAIADLNRRLRF